MIPRHAWDKGGGDLKVNKKVVEPKVEKLPT